MTRIGEDVSALISAGGVSGATYAWLWARLSFLPGTSGSALVSAVLGTAGGIIFDEIAEEVYRGRRWRRILGMLSSGVSVFLFFGYERYVLWATKSIEYVDNPWVILGEYCLLFAVGFLWGLLWAVAGRSAWNRIFPTD